MPVKRIDPAEAAKLLQEGWRYVDVRSVMEFERGHPAGAYNIPLADMIPGRGMAPNQQFPAAFAATFAPDDKVIVGCGSGGRSMRAAEILGAQGFTQVVDMKGGYEGEPGVPGWRPRGLPTSPKAEPGRTWEELRAKLAK